MPENTGDINMRILRSLQPIRSSVIFGTQEEPLVLERAWENGKKEKIRIVNPERSSQIPTYVFWDHTITQEQQSVIHEAFAELFQTAHLDTKQLSFLGNWHDDVYRDAQGNLLPNKSVEWQIQSKWNPQRRQANGSDIATAMFFDPYQVENPHWEALFTNLDLYDSRTNFLIGAAQPDLGTVISLHRLGNIADPGLRGEAEKTEIFHEFGHVLNLPSNRRGVEHIEQSLGEHCKNRGCSMKQGLSVPNDWIMFTMDRIQANRGPFCNDCQLDLTQKFHR